MEADCEHDMADTDAKMDNGNNQLSKCKGFKRMLKRTLLFWKRPTKGERSLKIVRTGNEYIDNADCVYETINRPATNTQTVAMPPATRTLLAPLAMNLENIDFIDLSQSEAGKHLVAIELDENEYQTLIGSSQTTSQGNVTRIRSAMSSFLGDSYADGASYQFQYDSSITRVDLCSSTDPENSEIDADSLDSSCVADIDAERCEYEAMLNSAQHIIANLKSNYKNRNEYIRNYCEDMKKSQRELFEELISSLGKCQTKVLGEISAYEETCKQNYHANPNYLASLESYSQSLRDLKQASQTTSYGERSAHERNQLQRRAHTLKRSLFRQEQLAKKYFLADQAIRIKPQLLEDLRKEIHKFTANYMDLQRAGPLTINDLTSINISKALVDLRPAERPLDIRTLPTGNILLVYKSWDNFLKTLEYNSELSFIQVLTSADRYNGKVHAKYMQNRYVTCTRDRFVEVLDNQLKRLHCLHTKCGLRLIGVSEQVIFFRSQATRLIHKYDWKLKHIGYFGQSTDMLAPFYVSAHIKQLKCHAAKYYWIDHRHLHVMDAVNGFVLASYECFPDQLEIDSATGNKVLLVGGASELLHFDERDVFEGQESLEMLRTGAGDEFCFFVDTNGQPNFYDMARKRFFIFNK